MTPDIMLDDLRRRMQEELTGNILPFWSGKAVDIEHGGFHGRINHTGEIIHDAHRSAVLNTRILWTFSAAYRHLKDPELLKLAERAFNYLDEHFVDKENGGVFWMTDRHGSPVDTRKHSYATAFAIYAFSEYYRASGSDRSLQHAKELFNLLEVHSFEKSYGCYYEAFDSEWNRLEDVRLSASDKEERFSMNTQLHLLEAFTTLYRIWPDRLLHERLLGLTELFINRIYDGKENHFHAFFDAEWNPVPLPYSYGHDIETIWLLADAANALSNDVLNEKSEAITEYIAANLIVEGYDEQMGGIFNSGFKGSITDTDKDWWAQAEAVVGFLEAYRITGDVVYIEKALHTWDFIESHVIDEATGEWHFKVDKHGNPRDGEDKLGPWKCPYHTARACIEAAVRIDHLQKTARKTESIPK